MESQDLSQFIANLRARREALKLSIEQITDALNTRGITVAYQTVAAWFNGSRGSRWKVDELRALLDVLETDLDAMAGNAELVEEPIAASVAREMRSLSEAQQQAILAMIRSMRP